MPVTEPPKPCEKFSDGRLSGFTEHIQTTGCEKCVALFLYLTRRDSKTKSGTVDRN